MLFLYLPGDQVMETEECLGNSETSELRYAREDVLRLAAEKGGSATIRDIVDEIGDSELASKAIDVLTKEGLITRSQDLVSLTDKGKKIAEDILKIHKAIEEFMKDHQLAHSLEHTKISPKALSNILSRGRIKVLTELGTGGVGRVVAVADPRPSLVARVYGVGLLPGRRVRVVARSRGLVVLEVGSEARVVALDEDVASKVLIAVEPCPGEKSGKG
jgi:Mn-dependent DtxR family transcriptional regulator/Fe2+ transport system protein FeoA